MRPMMSQSTTVIYRTVGEWSVLFLLLSNISTRQQWRIFVELTLVLLIIMYLITRMLIDVISYPQELNIWLNLISVE